MSWGDVAHVAIFHPGRAPSKQSRTGERYTRPAGMDIAVTSVSHSSLGAGAEKSCEPSSRSGTLGSSEPSAAAAYDE